MAGILLKAYRFWRSHGLRALLRVAMLRLSSRTKPSSNVILTAVLGVARRKPLTTHELIGLRFSPCAPLRTCILTNTPSSRVTLLTDSINQGSLYGGVGTALIVAALVANSMGARMRIVTRTERPTPANLHAVLATNRIRIKEDIEFAYAPYFDRKSEIDVAPASCF